MNVLTARMQDVLARVVARKLFSPVEGWTTLEAVTTALRVGLSERALHHGEEKSERSSLGMVVVKVVMSVLSPRRYGGGSQLVVFYGANPSMAAQVARKIRDSIVRWTEGQILKSFGQLIRLVSTALSFTASDMATSCLAYSLLA